MTWTTEKPTEDGLWWAFDGENVVPVDLYVTEFEVPGRQARMAAFELGSNYDVPRALEEFTHWMGPLLPPEPPQ